MKHKILLSAAAVLSALSLTGCYFFPAEEELLDPPTVAVEDIAYSTYTAKQKTIEDKTVATGYVVCKSQFNAGFPESGGTIKTIYVTAGQYVEKGDLLAELDTGNLSYLYEQQKLIVEKALLRYNSTGSADDRLTYEMEQNTLVEYERQLGNSRIYAGMTGQVCYVQSLNPGDTVTAYKTIVKIVDPTQICIQYTASNMKSFPLGQKVTITVDGEDLPGYVSKTPTEVTEGVYDEFPSILSDTESIYCEFTDELPSFLTVGQTADITAVFASHENAVVISKTLVKTDGDRTYVTILDENDNKTEVDVTVGIQNATEAEILTGLNAGDRVVVR
ncbi:MAG: biotin/lipoyl-binding protein [Oscillospiraceae bacterium]|nr:biotin/lipoyl-binding protein [Oscillospiraceae bacterium]